MKGICIDTSLGLVFLESLVKLFKWGVMRSFMRIKLITKMMRKLLDFKFDSVKLPQMHGIVPQKAKSVGKDTKHDVR